MTLVRKIQIVIATVGLFAMSHPAAAASRSVDDGDASAPVDRSDTVQVGVAMQAETETLPS